MYHGLPAVVIIIWWFLFLFYFYAENENKWQEREYIHVRYFKCHSQINLLFKIMIYYLVFSVILLGEFEYTL